MALIKLSQVVAILAFVIQLNLVVFFSFLFAVFGAAGPLYLLVAAVNILIGILALRAALITQQKPVKSGLEIIGCGLMSLSYWAITEGFEWALIPSGLFIVAGILAVAGFRLPHPVTNQYNP